MIQEATLATNSYSRHVYLYMCVYEGVHIYDSEYDPDFRMVSCPFFLGSTALPTDIHGLPVPGQKAKHFVCMANLCSHNGLVKGHQIAVPSFIAEPSARARLLSNITPFSSGETWIWSQAFWTPSPNLLALSLEVSEEVCTDRHPQSQSGKEFQVLISCL